MKRIRVPSWMDRLWKSREIVLILLTIVSFWWGWPRHPAELEVVRLSSLDLLSSLKINGMLDAESPLEIYWKQALRPSAERGIRLDSLTVTYVYVRNKGNAALEWSTEFDQPIEFGVDDPNRLLYAAVARWDNRPEGVGYEMTVVEGGHTCTFQTPLVRPEDAIGIAIVHTGTLDALRVSGRQHAHLPLQWSERGPADWKQDAASSAVAAGLLTFAGLTAVWFAGFRLTEDPFNAMESLARAGAIGIVVTIAGGLLSVRGLNMLPVRWTWASYLWPCLFALGAGIVQGILYWANAFSCRLCVTRIRAALRIARAQ